MTNSSKNIVISSYPKIKNLLNEGYSIIPNLITNTHMKVSFLKPHFFLISDKMSFVFFKTHYSNYKGPFTFAFIENGQMLLSSRFINKTHTSARPNKYKSKSLKQAINDQIVKDFSSGEIKTTLIPTDVKHTCSYTFYENYTYDLNILNNNSVIFNTPDVRLGDQHEMLKSDALLDLHFGLDKSCFKGFDGKTYYSKSNTFIKYLKDNNINYNQIELDFVSTPRAINDVLPEHPYSFEESHILKKNVIKS